MVSSIPSASFELYCRECGAAHQVQATRCFACGIAFSTASVGTVTRPFIGLLTSGFLLQQRYQILEVLSQEATKATYKAKDTRLSNRLVLIKEIDQQDENAQDASTALDVHRREALLLTGLVHPNLPRVYDFFLEGGRGYFVMDFLVGEPLEEYLRKSTDGCLPAHEALAIGIQLSSVLDYLQMRQLPLGFKDLSLNNILRTPDGQLYVLDVDSSPTPSNTAITHLGTTLRQLLTGKPASRKLVRFVPRSLFRRPRPSRVEDLIEQMMSQDACKRPVSMRVVNQELQYIATQEVAGRPFRKRRISRRTLLTSLAGLSIASGTGVLFGLIRLQPAPRPNYSSGLGRTVYIYQTQLPNNPPWNSFAAWVLAVEWSPNGKYIDVGCGGSRAYIVDVTTGNTLLTYTSHSKTVEIVAWSPLGHASASGSDDTTVRIWDPLSGKDSCV